MVKTLLGGLAALSLTAVPVLSFAQEADRASQTTDGRSNLGGKRNVLPLAVMLATIGGAIWLVVDDDDDDPVSV